VVDSANLITRPAAKVQAYCGRVGVEFRPEALTWQPSDRPEWEPSRRWHADVAASTGFAASAASPGIGIASYTKDLAPLERIMRNAMVFPLYDGGNQGVRRRQLHEMLRHPSYDPMGAAHGDVPPGV
jgi:alkylation response protein AidB-like acyl-CoA dehydrogenase